MNFQSVMSRTALVADLISPSCVAPRISYRSIETIFRLPHVTASTYCEIQQQVLDCFLLEAMVRPLLANEQACRNIHSILTTSPSQAKKTSTACLTCKQRRSKVCYRFRVHQMHAITKKMSSATAHSHANNVKCGTFIACTI